MRKLFALLGCTLVLLCSGCSFLDTNKYPDTYADLAKKAADEYLEQAYSTILADSEIEYKGFSVIPLNSKRIPQVTYSLDDLKTFHIWNSLVNPYDDIAYTLYSSAANEKITSLATKIFGSDIELEEASIGYYADSRQGAYADVDSFLASPHSYTFLVAVADKDIPDKLKLVEKFRVSLAENGIDQTFGVYFYNDYSEMLKDFNPDKAVGGYGDFTEWVFSLNNSEELTLRGNGITYRKSSKS